MKTPTLARQGASEPTIAVVSRGGVVQEAVADVGGGGPLETNDKDLVQLGIER